MKNFNLYVHYKICTQHVKYVHIFVMQNIFRKSINIVYRNNIIPLEINIIYYKMIYIFCYFEIEIDEIISNDFKVNNMAIWNYKISD